MSLNPFHATGLFRYPLKESEKVWFSDVFRGNRKRQWHEMGLWAQILIKFLPVMHISVIHDVFYNFSSGVINVENKEFWAVFHSILPQMLSNLYKRFTSDAIKLGKKKWISGSKDFLVYLLIKIQNRGKFISIAFAVKLKISKVSRTDSASTK